jgi:hypothetical protein
MRIPLGVWYFVLFVILVIVYSHVSVEYRKSEDLEIYEMDYKTNRQLQEICALKQPIVFNISQPCPELFQLDCDAWKNADITIKDCTSNSIETSDDAIVLPLRSASRLMQTDTRAKYYSEDNEQFLQDVGVHSQIRLCIDPVLKPPLSITSNYDWILGSTNAYTPLRYHTGYRQYYVVTRGKIRVKMTPYSSVKHMSSPPTVDNDFFGFAANKVNPWATTENSIKYVECIVNEGNVLYIPPYWWYSIQYVTKETTLVCCRYYSPPNIIANLPDWGRWFWTTYTTRTKVVRTLEDVVSLPESSLDTPHPPIE